MCVNDKYVQRKNLSIFMVLVLFISRSDILFITLLDLHISGSKQVQSFVIICKSFKTFHFFRQLNFVGKYLTGIEGYKMVDNQSLRKFVFSFLRQDGVFLLRMVAAHAGELPCYELSKTLWDQFIDNKEGGKDHV